MSARVARPLIRQRPLGLSSDSGQALPLLLAVVVGAAACSMLALSTVRALELRQQHQAIADLAALSGARAMWEGGDRRQVAHAAKVTGAVNGIRRIALLESGTSPPTGRVEVEVTEPIRVGFGALAVAIPDGETSTAEVVDWLGGGLTPGPGDYSGPFTWRQGKPMRPDVATAFDHMATAAVAAGLRLTVNSAWRSSAEQAALFAAHPDPKWVARPGQSLHRLGTELDLGPDATYGWLSINAGRFGFIQRYPWEPWHYGYTRSPGSTSVGFGRALAPRPAGRLSSTGALQPWVPAKYRMMILAASKRWGVSAALLAAQIRAESDFQPRSVSSAGARGISQLMPDEALRFHIDPFKPAEAIQVQARLMRELLARFGSVQLALAGYNAGPTAVTRCGCVPAYPETRAYVRRILGWLRDSQTGLIVRLVG